MANGFLLANVNAKQASDIRSDGNKSFAKGDYAAAVNAYSRCVAECLKALNLPAGSELEGNSKELRSLVGEVRGQGGGDAHNNDILEICNTLLLAWSNRAEAFLRLKRYDSALADAERALELEPTNLKSLNRKGKAFEALHKYEKANSCFLAAFKLSSQDEDIREALKRTKICAQQSLQGEFDLSKFYLNRCKGVFQPCCDYVGPVEIGRVQGSGRGLFLTRDVVAGELLFVSVAVAIAPILPEPSIAPKGLRFQSKEQEADHLVTKLAKVAQICPRARDQLLTLPFTDTEQGVGIPSMDLFRPGSDWSSSDAGSAELNAHRICGIAHFSSYNLHTHTADISDNYVPRPLKRTGVWPIPSFLHHSCFPNCLRIHVGDAMFVRAARDMASGEVLTVAWFDVSDPLKARQDSCRNWGFLCRCDRCIFEEGLEPLELMGKRFFELLQVNPQEWTVRLASLLPAVEEIIQSRVNLEAQQRNWIRASCIYAYIAQAELLRSDLERRIPFLEAIVESVTSVAAAGMCGLEYSAELLRDVGRFYGKFSEEYAKTEKRVMDIFRIAYGTQNKAALLALVQNFLRASEVPGARNRRPS
ncbi:unnamed protein product [Calypogeia fissa]